MTDHHHAEPPGSYARNLGGRWKVPDDLRLAPEVRIVGVLGRGYRANVYEARYREEPIALKVYLPRYVQKCRRKLGMTAAEFEYERNAEFFAMAELRPFVARPVARWLERDGWTDCFAQELLRGTTLHRLMKTTGTIPFPLVRELREFCHNAWAAGLYDLDLQLANVAVVTDGDSPRVKLFDFNLIPRNLGVPRLLRPMVRHAGRPVFKARDRRWLQRIAQLAGEVGEKAA